MRIRVHTWLPTPNPMQGVFGLVRSHGNAMDCGLIFHYWVEMAHRLNCDIFAYDYTG